MKNDKSLSTQERTERYIIRKVSLSITHPSAFGFPISSFSHLSLLFNLKRNLRKASWQGHLQRSSCCNCSHLWKQNVAPISLSRRHRKPRVRRNRLRCYSKLIKKNNNSPHCNFSQIKKEISRSQVYKGGSSLLILSWVSVT